MSKETKKAIKKGKKEKKAQKRIKKALDLIGKCYMIDGQHHKIGRSSRSSSCYAATRKNTKSLLTASIKMKTVKSPPVKMKFIIRGKKW